VKTLRKRFKQRKKFGIVYQKIQHIYSLVKL